MANPILVMFVEAKGIVVIGFIVFVFLIILGILASMPGAPSDAKVIANQVQQTISWLWIFYLGIPSVGVIIAIIIWIRKKQNQEGYL